MRKAVLIVDMQPVFLDVLEERALDLTERVKSVVNAAEESRVPVIYVETYVDRIPINDESFRTLESLGRRKEDMSHVLLKNDKGIRGNLNYLFRDVNRLFLMGISTGLCFKSTLYEVLGYVKEVDISVDTTADINEPRYSASISEFRRLARVNIHLDYRDMISQVKT